MAAALAAVLPLAFAGPALAAVELDQSQQSGLARQSVQLMVQTLIAGKTGLLDHVDLKLFAQAGSVSVTVRQANPDGTPVTPASTEPTATRSGYMSGTYPFDFSKANISITKGTTYEIFVKTVGYVYWYYTGTPPEITQTFLGGNLYVGCTACTTWYSGASYGAAFVFATYVNTDTVPTPVIQPPTITLDKAGTSVSEGIAPTMSGTFSDPSGAAVTLTATAGTVTPTSATASGTWSWTEPAPDESVTQVSVTITDSHGLSASTPLFTVTATEVKPTATIVSVKPTDRWLANLAIFAPQESLSFTGASSDGATQETLTVSWDFGDYGLPGSGLVVAHTYAARGTYAVTLTVTDDEGAQGQATIQVTVGTPQDVLAAMDAYIGKLSGLNAGQKNSLIVKLDAASDSITRGDTRTANNQLNAFLNELIADQRSNRISSDAFNTLVADMHLVQGAVGTYNRFLEWWPLEA